MQFQNSTVFPMSSVDIMEYKPFNLPHLAQKSFFIKPLSKDLAILVLQHIKKYLAPHGLHGFLFCTINKSTYCIMWEHIVFRFTRPSFYNAKVHQGKMIVIM